MGNLSVLLHPITNIDISPFLHSPQSLFGLVFCLLSTQPCLLFSHKLTYLQSIQTLFELPNAFPCTCTHRLSKITPPLFLSSSHKTDLTHLSSCEKKSNTATVTGAALLQELSFQQQKQNTEEYYSIFETQVFWSCFNILLHFFSYPKDI